MIGIGAGPGCDGQVLVLHDLLGLGGGGFQPRFVKSYVSLGDQVRGALERYRQEVTAGAFPAQEHCFTIPDEELAKLEA